MVGRLRSLQSDSMGTTSQIGRVRREGLRSKARGQNNRDGSCWTLAEHLETIQHMAIESPASRSSPEASAASTEAFRLAPASTESRRGRPLLWLVFTANCLVFLAALLLLTFSPITIDAPIEIDQFALLLAGFVVLVALEPADVATCPLTPRPPHRGDDVGRPGPAGPATFRGPTHAAPRARRLPRAFNAMLDRLESARREAARTALAAQEAERLRVARELHDEIGQTLTAVTLQAERAAEGDPALGSGGSDASPMPSATASTKFAESPASCGPRRSTISVS